MHLCFSGVHFGSFDRPALHSFQKSEKHHLTFSGDNMRIKLTILSLIFFHAVAFSQFMPDPGDALWDGAIGYASPVCLLGTVTFDDFYEILVWARLYDGVYSCGCEAENRMMRAQPREKFGWNELALMIPEGGDHYRSFEPHECIGPGTYNIIIGGSSGISCYHEWGAKVQFGFRIYHQCPDTNFCAKGHCDFCDMDYCAVHKRHITRLLSHGFNLLPGAPPVEHSHCSNSEALLDEWENNARIRTCPNCGQPFCPLCPHTCGEFTCPNTPHCVSATCPICGGTYCTVHSYHVCSNFHEAAEHVGNSLVSVQTSVSGQAIVNVDIAPGSVNFDTSPIVTSIVNGVASLQTSLSSVQSEIQGSNSRLDQLKTIADAISTKTDTISANSEYLPVINQVLEGLQDPIFDLRDASIDIHEGILVGIEGQNQLWAEVVDFKNMSDLQLADLNLNIQENGAVLLDSKTLLQSIDDSLKNGSDIQPIVSAINNFAVANNSNLQALSETNTQIAGSTASIDSKLDGIGSSVASLGTPLNSIDNSMDEISSDVSSIAEGVQSLIDKKEAEEDLGFNSPSVGFGVPSDFVSPYDGVTADLPSITDLDFSAVKSKLLPPANMFSNLSGTSLLSFDLPLIGDVSLDLLSDSGPSHLIRLFSYAVCSLMYLFTFVSGVVRVFRQY